MGAALARYEACAAVSLARTLRGQFGAGGTAWASSSNTSVVTPTFTPSNNSDLYFAFYGSASNTVTLSSITIAGGSLTWELVLDVQTAQGDGYVLYLKVWRARISGTAPSGMAITVTHNSMTNADMRATRMGFGFDYTGAHVATPIGATITGVNLGSGAVNITLNATPANDSHIIAICGNAPNGAGALTATPASGWTELYDANNAGWGHMQMQVREGGTSTAVQWDDVAVGDTVYSNDSAALAFEIKAAGVTAHPRFHAEFLAAA